MRELIEEVLAWTAGGARVALAKVVALEGSGPREPGAAMAVHEDGRVLGSVSGGCVEGAVVAEAMARLADGRPSLVRFGYSDDEAFAVGLTCGGTLTVLVTPEPPATLSELAGALRAEEPVALATVVRVDLRGLDAPSAVGPEPTAVGVADRSDPATAGGRVIPAVGDSLLVRADGSFSGRLGGDELFRVVARDAQGALAAGRSELRHYGLAGEARSREVEVFLEAFGPPPRMVIFGAVDFTAALVRLAKFLGYRVTVCDARAVFATRARFPMADEVVVDWPQRYLEREGGRLDRRDAICVLTHDPKFDVPALVAALATDAGYVGAMGSRRTHAERVARLREAGVAEADLARIMAPIGLDLGARTPEETAVAIAAEIIARRSGHEPGSLRDGSGPIHRAGASQPA